MRIEEAFAKVETPAYVVSEDLIRKNLQILHDVEEQSGAHILLAQKAFSMYSLYPLIGEYISGATASGINEARLGYEYMGKENHIFAPAYKENEFDEIVKICDHIIFNSYNQFAKYKDSVKKAGISCGIRVNPQFSTQEGHEIYDPCQPGSRMGITLSEFEKHDFTGIEGIHFHTLCEQNSDALVATLKVVEEQFGQYFSQLKWINFGGGHHITKPDYDRKALIDAIKYIREKYNLIVYLEPGEAIAVDTGYMVTEVMDFVHNHIDIAILRLTIDTTCVELMLSPVSAEFSKSFSIEAVNFSKSISSNSFLIASAPISALNDFLPYFSSASWYSFSFKTWHFSNPDVPLSVTI